MNYEEFAYTSSVDGASPLLADVAFIADGKPKPLVAVMHGYGGDRSSVAKDIRDLARRGLFCIAPDMRGRGRSAGRWDSGGLDVYDIVDGLLAAIREYGQEIDATNLNLVGYSGGGGNCFAAMTRFPDLFHVVAPFFGISDYGLWHETEGRSDCNEVMRSVLGGSPSKVPEVYAARNACLSAGNCAGARLHVFWDEAETQCPPILNERFLEPYHAAGLSHATAHISAAGDEFRWHHGYRTDNPLLEKADDLFCADIFSPVPDLSLPSRGALTACGYLVTRHFQVFVDDGQRGVVGVEYDLTGPSPTIAIVDNPGQWRVTVSQETPLAALP